MDCDVCITGRSLRPFGPSSPSQDAAAKNSVLINRTAKPLNRFLFIIVYFRFKLAKQGTSFICFKTNLFIID